MHAFQKLIQSLLAALLLGVASLSPVAALAAVPGVASSSLLGAVDTGECQEVKAKEGAAADVAIKARLVVALCKENSGVAVALAFVAGLLTSLSPCVYPLIPITVSIFGARGAKSRWHAFSLSALYVLGMATLYTVLGVTFASLGMVSGSLMAMPWVVVGMGLLCLAMAASMFGAFEISLPSSIQTRLSMAGGAGYKGSFVMGLAAGVVAAPCTGPVLAVILGLISKSGRPGMGAALMGSYSLGMGMLFLVLGTFSGALSAIPKSGRWMETVKGVLGLSMMAAAFYLVKPQVGFLKSTGDWLAELPNAVITGTALLLAGFAVGALHLSFKDEGWMPKLRKGVGLTLSTVGLFTWVSFAAAVPASSALAGPASWFNDHDEALAAGRKLGRPVMMDFGADWCAACKELEKFTYTDAAVKQEMQRFVVAKIDATDSSDALNVLFAKYGITGLPAVVFFDSKGNALKDPRVDGFMEPPEYLLEMRKVQ